MDSSNFSKRLLKDTEGAETISLGNEFHVCTLRLEKQYSVPSIEQCRFME